ncbi:LLM class flavin-dependent oxidoreductase [Agromyces seonyuensis]|uniref:LLM class flavin-dependent oxidoreductase n=1 Tax=Agromyces seonyuensis TaxID=2662446 RepID=A0A6I4P6N8_9MICO|nr:LLM class flavin-dependent oxidoreductase [Agromyces seonyuensis]MWC00300.1 LLM class flavin-dependent oxidoreductase [Agromyces seonyuensis]
MTRSGDTALLLPRDLPAGDVLDYARRAEAVGFDELWVVEDLGYRGGIAQASAVLAATSRIRVGIGILPAAARNSAFAAMELGTLAALFPGRLVVGLGHGMPGWMRQAGVWPASPITMLREQTEAIRGLLAGETVDVDGRYVQLDGVRLEHPPTIVPPLLAGVRGPKSLAAAGEFADGVVLAEPVTPEYLAAVRERLGAGAAEARIVAFQLAVVDEDAAAARSAVRPGLAWIGDPDWAPHIDPLDFADEFRALRAGAADREAFAAALPDAWVDRLAVVGTPEDARASVARLHAAGASAVVLIPARSAIEEVERLGAALPR